MLDSCLAGLREESKAREPRVLSQGKIYMELHYMEIYLAEAELCRQLVELSKEASPTGELLQCTKVSLRAQRFVGLTLQTINLASSQVIAARGCLGSHWPDMLPTPHTGAHLGNSPLCIPTRS